jgi:hypothetical protein
MATPAPAKTTVNQVASIVARDGPPLRAAISFEDQCRSFDCLVAVNLLARWSKIADLSRTLAIDLEAAKPVPSEVRSLVDQTISAAKRVDSTYTDLHDCGQRTGSMFACGFEQDTNEQAWRAMKPQLDAWPSYTHGAA